MALKERYQYIEWVDEQKSDFRLMAPLVRSAGISLDNTCSAIRSFREFISYKSDGVSTGQRDESIGAIASLNAILKDTSDINIRKKCDDYKTYLRNNDNIFRESCSYGSSFDNFRLDNCNIYTLQIDTIHKHSPYVAPIDTIIFNGKRAKDYSHENTICSWLTDKYSTFYNTSPQVLPADPPSFSTKDIKTNYNTSPQVLPADSPSFLTKGIKTKGIINFVIDLSIFTSLFIALVLVNQFFPSIMLQYLTVGILSKLPLIGSVPLLHFIILCVIFTLCYRLISKLVFNSKKSQTVTQLENTTSAIKADNLYDNSIPANKTESISKEQYFSKLVLKGTDTALIALHTDYKKCHNDSKKIELQCKRIKVLLDGIVSNFNNLSRKTNLGNNSVISPSFLRLKTLGYKNDDFDYSNNMNLKFWDYEKRDCKSTSLDTGDGSLRSEESSTTITTINDMGIRFIYDYISQIFVNPAKLDDEELIVTLINIADIQPESIEKNDDLFKQIYTLGKTNETRSDLNVLLQFIQGMILIYAKDNLAKFYICEEFDVYTNSFSENSEKIFYNAVEYHHSNNCECIIKTLCHRWFNNINKDNIPLSAKDIEVIKDNITRKWEAMTGRCYAEGRKAQPGDKMAYFDQLIVVSDKKGPFKEFQNAISCELKTFGRLQYGIR